MADAVLTDQGGPFTHLDELVRFANSLVDAETDAPPRLLDLRCGAGALIRAFAPHGWEAIGVDASVNLTGAAASSLPATMVADFVVASRAAEIDLRERQFTLIVGFDDLAGDLLDIRSLEQFLQMAQPLLAPGGHLVFQLERTTAFSSTESTIETIRNNGFDTAWRASPIRLDQEIPAEIDHAGTRDIFVAGQTTA